MAFFANIDRLVYQLVYLLQTAMKIKIGSYEAKTRLPELLREVQMGKQYIITLRGKPVAELSSPEVASAVEGRQACTDMQAFMHAQAQAGAGAHASLRELIDEGRS